MNLIEAIKSGRPFRRKSWPKHWRCEYTVAYDNKSLPDFWILRDNGEFPDLLFSVTGNRELLLADDWEIEEKKVEISAKQFWEAVREIKSHVNGSSNGSIHFTVSQLHDLAAKLGLGGEK